MNVAARVASGQVVADEGETTRPASLVNVAIAALHPAETEALRPSMVPKIVAKT